jgi:hypothetical protein
MPTPQLTPYTPSLYQPDSYGRYRHYPRTVRTPIPGAGYRAGHLAWAEQELNLDGSSRPQPYGNYSVVPLRGLGQVSPFLVQKIVTPIERFLPRSPSQPSPTIVDSTVPLQPPPQIVSVPPPQAFQPPVDETAAAQRAIEQASQAATLLPPAIPFFEQRLGPVPYWAVGLGGLLVVGGVGTWLLLRRRRSVAANRRRRTR